MYFQRYHIGQYASVGLLILISLIGVVWLNQALRLLELVISRGAPLFSFLYLSILALPLWLMVAAPLAAFIAVIWVLNRLTADRELIVMQALGLSPLQFGWLPILFGAMVTALLVINSLWLLPAGFSEFKTVQHQLRHSIPKVLIQNKVFIDLDDKLTIFIGGRAAQNEVTSVFIQDSRQDDRTVTVTAQKGRFEVRPSGPVLLLENGQRTELRTNGAAAAVLAFETHSIDIARAEANQDAERTTLDVNEDSIRNLLDPSTALSPRYVGERIAQGHYRLASPFMALALCVLATASLLSARLRRDGMGRQIGLTIAAGIGLQILLVMARSATVSNPALWPLIYLICIAPIPIGIMQLTRQSMPKLLNSTELVSADSGPGEGR